MGIATAEQHEDLTKKRKRKSTKEKAKSAKTRTRVAKSRQKLAETGGKRIEIRLSPEGARCVEILKETAAVGNIKQLVEWLLLQAVQGNVASHNISSRADSAPWPQPSRLAITKPPFTDNIHQMQLMFPEEQHRHPAP